MPTPHQFFARLVTDPTRSIIFTSPQQLSDALHAFETMKSSKSKSTLVNRFSTPSALNSTMPTIGDFTNPVTLSDKWIQSLESFHSFVPDKFCLKAGVIVDNRRIPSAAIPTYRRTLLAVIIAIQKKYAHAFKLFEFFDAMILAPSTRNSNFVTTIKQRCTQFLAGDWSQLVCNVRFKT